MRPETAPKTESMVDIMQKLSDCELFLLDMDGTLYLGDEVFPGAIEFVQRISASGKKYIYLTNNSSRAGEDYIARLRKLGFPCDRENVYTSGMATAAYLNANFPGKTVFSVGTLAFCHELESYGVRLGEEEPSVVAVGFDRELTYAKLEKAVRFLKKGAAFVAANPDLVCPMPGGEVLPDCGSICALLAASTGREPVYIGKPNRDMVDIISKEYCVPNSRIACIGDRMYTDIAVAGNAGAVSVLVMSGETNKELLEASPYRPDYIFDSVADIMAFI